MSRPMKQNRDSSSKFTYIWSTWSSTGVPGIHNMVEIVSTINEKAKINEWEKQLTVCKK